MSDLPITDQAPAKIASNFISVDCSDNGYFCIYLTENGGLYGMGANLYGLLGQNYDPSAFSAEDAEKITTPVLLMDNVAYAKAGRKSITALKKDGSVWWWGQYRSTYKTGSAVDDNLDQMLYTSPHKILDDCIYATTGNYTGAAITENGDLYT